MRFYTQQHRFYCGIDLHARTMHVCILDHAGNVVFDKNLPCHFDTLLQAIAPFRDGIVKVLGILAARLARAVYHLLRKQEAFDEERFWSGPAQPSQAPTKPRRPATARRSCSPTGRAAH